MCNTHVPHFGSNDINFSFSWLDICHKTGILVWVSVSTREKQFNSNTTISGFFRNYKYSTLIREWKISICLFNIKHFQSIWTMPEIVVGIERYTWIKQTKIYAFLKEEKNYSFSIAVKQTRPGGICPSQKLQ